MENAPRRVLCILENAGAGSGRHVIDLSRGLIERGHDVSLLFSRARLEGWFEDELADTAELTSATIEMRSGMGAGDIASLRAVRRFLRQNGPFDVVHGHSSKGGALARLATRDQDAARVYTPHALYTLGCAPGSARRHIFAGLERILARRCDGIICVSMAEQRHALECGLPAGKLFTVPNGLAPLPAVDRSAMRDALGLTDGQIAIGFVGRLARQKAVHRLIHAFAAVSAAQPEARLVIVGDGPDSASARALAHSEGIANAIIFTGSAPGEQMMGAFDVFACCSLYEAFPYVFLEALARGLPVVSTRVGGVDELIHDGVNGHVLEQDDDDGFAHALQALVVDNEQRRSMGDESKKIVADFDINAMVQKTLDVYTTLLEMRGHAAASR